MFRSLLLVSFLLLNLFALAQEMPFGLTGKTMLLAMNDVKKEVHLTKDQEKKILGLAGELQKNPSQFGMPDMHYMMRPIDVKAETILDADQNARLRELFWQFNGLLALSETDLCDALSLTAETKSAAKDLIKAYDKAVMDKLMASKGKFDKKAMATIREKAVADLAALLTPEQQEKWKTLQGKAFKFKGR